MTLIAQTQAEPIPGYRLLEPLGRGGFGEVWKCEAPGGFLKALKIVPGGQHLGGATAAFEQERRALDHVKTIRHPFLLSLERVELSDGDLLIVMELADKNLRRLLEEYRLAGDPGIPRDELLGYLLEAAEALDLMNLQHHLLHLDVKPDNLFVVCNHVKVADFGLVGSATDDGEVSTAGITPLYTAPERFRGQVAPTSDQYSLALAYCELLTGAPPFDGKNFRQLLLQHTGQPPDLSALPEADQPVLTKALAKDPAQRFASSMEFVQALYTGRIEPARAEVRAEGPAQPGSRRSPSFVATRELRRALHAPERRREEEEGTAPAVPRSRPRVKPAAGQSPLPGYEFLDRLGQGPCGEYWRAAAPHGGHRLVHLVYGYPPLPPAAEEQAFQSLKALRHPGLAKVEVLRDGAGRFFLLTDLPESTLYDRFKQCRAESRPGIPRDELLSHLGAAAATLDELYEDRDLLHLGLTPEGLRLADGRVRVADFGPIHLFWVHGGALSGPLNARYAAPELFRESPRRPADVYGLALLYAELLTGHHPFRSPANRPDHGVKRDARPNLGRLPEADRAVLARALDRQPANRPASCLALIEELRAKPRVMTPSPAPRATPTPPPVPVREEARPAAETKLALPSLTPVLTELVSAAAGDMRVLESGNLRYLLYPGTRLAYQGAAAMPAELARFKLEGFLEEWHGRVVGGNGREHFVLHVDADVAFWQRYRSRKPGLVVEVWLRRGGPAANLIEIAAQVQPAGCDAATGARLLEQSAPALLASLRSYLQPQPEQRAQPRLLLEQPVRVRSVLPDRRLGETLNGVSRNVSLDGMRLWLPQAPPGPQVCIQFPQVIRPGLVEALAQVRNTHPASDGGYELGVRFIDHSP